MDFMHLFTFVVGVLICFAIAALVIVLKDLRRAFTVPEGSVGLLYHKGKFVKVLDVGRHVSWGFHHTAKIQDLRRTTLLVAGQDVLTGDNVSLKLSLLVTYQVSDRSR